jgi:hypothetical protein
MHNETTSPLSFWTLLLSISTRFEMHRVRSRAITEINIFHPRIDPVDQVVLAVRHNVPEWLPQAYTAICKRAEPIEIDDARKLGLETTVLLAKAREGVRNPQKPHVHANTPRDASEPNTKCYQEPNVTLEQASYNMGRDWGAAVADSPELKPCLPIDPRLLARPDSPEPCFPVDPRLLARPDSPEPCLLVGPRSGLNSPQISHIVPMQAAASDGVIDDSLVRHVIDGIFWPTSEPPGTEVSDQIIDFPTAVSSNRLLTFV